MHYSFWTRWLFLVSVIFTGFGVLIALFPETPILALWHDFLARTFFAGDMPDDAARLRSFLFGPLGGTIAGFYVFQGFVVRNAFAHRERWAWWAILLATAFWFITDSSMSLVHGAWWNVLLVNVPALLLNAIPLAMTVRAVFTPMVDEQP